MSKTPLYLVRSKLESLLWEKLRGPVGQMVLDTCSGKAHAQGDKRVWDIMYLRVRNSVQELIEWELTL